jgi:tetratricopeptide (TPR) repeat protein
LTIEPDNVDALNNIGAALGSLGNFTEAIKYFDKVLAIEPDNVKALISKDKALGNLDNHTKEVR